MTENTIIGFMLILAGGFFQGTFMLPMKYTTRWNWENTWLGFALVAYLICPWTVTLLTVPHLRQVLALAGGPFLIRILLWGLAWGVGGLMFGLGVDALGLALGFAIIIGLTAAIGTLIPLLMLAQVKPASVQGVIILSGILVALIGIAVCSYAGKLRETAAAKDPAAAQRPAGRSYALGVLFCLLSGVLSPCGNLAFAFGSAMTTAATKLGAAAQYASNPLWALLCLGLLFCNTAYSVILLRRKHTFGKFLQPGVGKHYLLAVSMGVMWLAGIFLYGMGAIRLGKMGSSIGWALVMSFMVVVANLWGISTGEWSGADRRPLRVMITGLGILVVAMFMVGSGIR
jgi:L-rhamnose-H+ transport protein